jgi:transposase
MSPRSRPSARPSSATTTRWSYRRLSKDYQDLTAASEAAIYLAMIRLLLRRLTRP